MNWYGQAPRTRSRNFIFCSLILRREICSFSSFLLSIFLSTLLHALSLIYTHTPPIYPLIPAIMFFLSFFLSFSLSVCLPVCTRKVQVRKVREVLAILFSETGPRTGHVWGSRMSIREVWREPFSREIREVARNGGKIMVLSYGDIKITNVI